MNTQLSPELMAMAARLAERHRIPETDIVHPKVFVPDHKGGVNEFMTAKLREPHYVPYCLIGRDCARVRRTEWGFQCPYCGNKMNFDLSHYDGNANVKYDGPAPVLTPKQWNEQVTAKKQARAQRRVESKFK